MEEIARRALEAASRAGAEYADVRVVEREGSYILVKNDNVEAVAEGSSQGFGLRVLLRGAWGFASSSRPTAKEVDRAAATAVRIARASATVARRGVRLAPAGAPRGTWRSAWRRDPMAVPLEERIALLVDAQARLAVDPAVKIRTASASSFRERKTFASTEGALVEQELLITGGGIHATALGEGEVQGRSYPAAFGGDFRAAGWEFVEGLDLVGRAEEVGREAVALLGAQGCPSGPADLVLGTNQVALQVHESCGHPTELDRVLGMEASYAGTSFLTPEKRGSFRYGSPAVHITADATIEGGLGTFAWDDEGVEAQAVDLVRDGTFVGYQSSRETAADFGWRSSGGMRADGWDRIPLIRMTNINLEPGDWGFDEIVEETREGIYMETNRSWSIDDLRLNFQFGTEIAWAIRGGELGEIYRNPTYTGITYEFWRSCDAVGREATAHLWGVPNCGKGEPGQTMRVGHRTVPARFRGVRVGVA